MQGHDTTLPVTLDDMIYHTRLVARGARRGLPVIADMPLGSYHVEPAETVRAAVRLLKEAGAARGEARGRPQAPRPICASLLDAEIPVMGHLGLTPQSRPHVRRLQGAGPR